MKVEKEKKCKAWDGIEGRMERRNKTGNEEERKKYVQKRGEKKRKHHILLKNCSIKKIILGTFASCC